MDDIWGLLVLSNILACSININLNMVLVYIITKEEKTLTIVNDITKLCQIFSIREKADPV